MAVGLRRYSKEKGIYPSYHFITLGTTQHSYRKFKCTEFIEEKIHKLIRKTVVAPKHTIYTCTLDR